jgi:hypothetical protein
VARSRRSGWGLAWIQGAHVLIVEVLVLVE